MLYRNLLAMDAEEALRAYPADGVVLLGGCDKTVPGARDGRDQREPADDLRARPGRCCAATGAGRSSARAPTRGSTGTRSAPALLDDCAWREMEDGIARSFGTCMTMGTASTMAAAVDALGLTLPGASSIPAADSSHPRMALGGRPPHRRDGVGGPDAARDPDDRGVRERGDGGDGARRIDQRDHPSRRDGGTRRRGAGPRSLRRAVAAHAVPREHPAVRASS